MQITLRGVVAMPQARAMGVFVGRLAGARQVFGHRRLAQFEQEGFVVGLRGAQGQPGSLVGQLGGHVGKVVARDRARDDRAKRE
ncbi:hypothetical protein QF001_002121 [Paraburkholderia youngii]